MSNNESGAVAKAVANPGMDDDEQGAKSRVLDKPSGKQGSSGMSQ